VMMHFGIEGAALPSTSQQVLARRAIDAGADVVVGSHPHVLQTVETYKDRIILYSMGNFAFDGFSGKENDSAIAWIQLRPGGRISLQLLPVRIRDGKPELLEVP
jgi:gamma-polyglutamate biosynthesis protein CapA